MFRCLLSSKSELQTSNSDYAVLPESLATSGWWRHGSALPASARAKLTQRANGEIPAARLAAWRNSKCGLVAVRTGRSFIEPPMGRLQPCKNLNYQRLNGQVPRCGKFKYRRTHVFSSQIKGTSLLLEQDPAGNTASYPPSRVTDRE